METDRSTAGGQRSQQKRNEEKERRVRRQTGTVLSFFSTLVFDDQLVFCLLRVMETHVYVRGKWWTLARVIWHVCVCVRLSCVMVVKSWDINSQEGSWCHCSGVSLLTPLHTHTHKHTHIHTSWQALWSTAFIHSRAKNRTKMRSWAKRGCHMADVNSIWFQRKMGFG